VFEESVVADDGSMSDELAEVTAAEGEEAQEAAALREMNTVQEESESESDEGESEDGEDHCHVCREGEEGDVLLLCDGCDNACHLSCCEPPLKRVPKGNWYCITCSNKKKGDTKKNANPSVRGKKAEPVVAKKTAATKTGAVSGRKGPAAVAKETGSKRSRAAPADTPAKKRSRAAPVSANQESVASRRRVGGRAVPTEAPSSKRTTRSRR